MSGDDLHTIGDDYLERGGTLEQNGRTRTPPHGDVLRPNVAPLLSKDEEARLASILVSAAVNRRMRKLAAEISRRTPVSAPPIYRALFDHSAEEVEAAINLASRQGVDPAHFAEFLDLLPDYTATRRAMAGPEIPHNEAGVPIMPDATPPRRLPSCVDRAARKAYTVGYQDAAWHRDHDDRHGIKAFRESLRRDGEGAQAATPAPAKVQTREDRLTLSREIGYFVYWAGHTKQLIDDPDYRLAAGIHEWLGL